MNDDDLLLFDVQCVATSDVLLTLEARNENQAEDRARLAFCTTPQLTPPHCGVLLYEHDPSMPVTGLYLRDGHFALLEQQLSTRH
jgi:hypothetical protein